MRSIVLSWLCVIATKRLVIAASLLAAPPCDGNIQLISSKNHYVFNLAWLRDRPK